MSNYLNAVNDEIYDTLMQGLESAVGTVVASEPDQGRNYAYTTDGKRYLSALPTAQPGQPLKSEPMRGDRDVSSQRCRPVCGASVCVGIVRKRL